MLKQLFHIAINSKDLERSLAFYRRLGFQVVQDRVVHNEKVREAFRVPTGDLRFVHLRIGDSEKATLLDIVEWGGPGTADGTGPPPQHQQGITRFAVLTDDTDRVYRELKQDGVEFLTLPTLVMTPEGGWKVCLALDPDGTVVQITELIPAPETMPTRMKATPQGPSTPGVGASEVTAADPRISWGALRAPGPVGGVTAAVTHGARLSAALYTLEPGAVVPEHAHENEEFGQVISGSLELQCAGQTMVLGAGEAFLVPGGVPHGARANAEGCELVECYAPPRDPVSRSPIKEPSTRAPK